MSSSNVNTVSLEVDNGSITPVTDSIDVGTMAETQDTQGASSTAGKELDLTITLECDIISVEWRVL